MVVESNGKAGNDQSLVKTARSKVPSRYVREGRRLAKVTTNFVKKLTRGNSMYIHNQKFHLFTLVGIVEDFQDKEKDGYEFNLSDTEGEVLVRYFWPKEADRLGNNGTIKPEDNDTVKPENSASIKPIVKNGSLVRVFGSFISSTRSSSGSFVCALKVVPLTDLNELTMHNLEVLDMMITLKKVKENVLANRPPTTGFPSVTVEAHNDHPKVPQEKDNKSMVLETIKQNADNKGVPLAEIQKSLPGILSEELRVILDVLLKEGEIFTTVDDNWFKAS